MKKLFFSIALPFLMVSLSAQTCHFQQGFESTSPAGWVRNCGGTTGLNHGLYNGSGVEEPAAGQRKAYDNIVTDFGDGSWGTVADALPSSGSYPTSDTINDFVLNKAIVYKGSTTDASGEKHTNRICIDKKTTGGNLELPWLKTLGQVEIHAAVGTAGNTFTVDEYENNLWKVLETFSAIKTDSTFYLNIERDDTTRLRISNNSGGSVVIWKVLTRSRDEVRNLNVVSSTPAQNAVCFYNLTKEVKITFNKELVFGTGTIQLNDVAIPLSSCTIDEKTLIVPVTLESTQGRNKSYSLTIPAGALAEKNSAENLNQEYILNFQTLRKPSMPANYQEIIDIHYSGASEEMCRMDFYYPAGAAEATPVLINMHGGGWNHGAKEEQTGFGSFFSMGFAVANVEYRMTPQATAPAAVEDVRCAMQYLLKNAEALNIDPRKIVFQGSSAGGHLALTAGYLQNNRLYDTNCNDYKGEIKVLAVIDKYGPAKLEDFMFYTSLVNWLGEHAGDDEFVKTVSPYHLVDGNTPPTYIVHGDADPTVPYAQSVSLSGTLETNNVYHQFTTIPGGGHGGFEAQYNTQISNEITAFLNYLLGQVASSGSIEMKKKVQPRVVDNIICFNTNEEISFEVFDAQGRKIGKSNDNSFTLEHNGMFIIKAGTGDWKQAFKIIK
ncbi:MAG: alpha/beta hydrolase fold domain-containing protein [Prevotellaceae bacterium]|jgi:acetyl esterase/lipase|nr:alpha/beta hydrolase fold domain-containing protein [Prevotellaceae bacterium]